ncbi:MAG: hypothetical protein VYC34_10560 [Planctomycetota bacterium]|nr:hypothetical protein [Planctomycetota bacterium]
MAVVALAGCAKPQNPSFPLTVSEAKRDLRAMRESPKTLSRPVVVMAGYGDPGVASSHIASRLRRMLDGEDGRVLTVNFGMGLKTFDDCRAHAIEAVEARFPSDDPEWTVEVDVISHSMGGLIARHAAVARAGEKTLRIRRLLSISSPHQGAMMAGVPTTSEILIDMRPGSAFLEELNAAPMEYTLIPYARLGDTWVGLENTGLPGEQVWWVPNRPFSAAHLGAYSDPRFLADIARRLRGEQPYTSLPRAPIPE